MNHKAKLANLRSASGHVAS